MTSIYKKSQVCSFNNLYAICVNERKLKTVLSKKNQSNFFFLNKAFNFVLIHCDLSQFIPQLTA